MARPQHAKRLRDITGLRKEFPDDFLWGASVASHQVEGGTTNQWTKWEHEQAARQAATAKERLDWLPVWDDIAKQANNPLNYVSGQGVDHYRKYKLDFQLAKSLNLNSMRSGIEWSRINPDSGVFDVRAVDYYSKYFKSMKTEGLEPFVNLFHWTLPQWFADLGGFEKRGNLSYWRDYIHTLVQNMDFTSIKYVLLINEANTYSSMSYGVGEFPPGVVNFAKSLRVYRNLALAHKMAYKIIKAKYPEVQIGSAHQCNSVVGHGFFGKFAASFQLWYWNWSWLKWAKYHDFIGVNYYFTDHRRGLSLAPNANPSKPVNDLGWYMKPSGIEQVIRGVAKRWPKKPIFITENGVADMHDQYREWWISETMVALSKCLKDGIMVKGYLHWSLLDNFEWQYGWFPKFGLISVDRKTMMRKVKKSAKIWAAWLRG
jgi:beta-glucosidase